MKNLKIVAGALALSAVATALYGFTGPGALGNFATAMSEAQSLDATYTLGPVGAAPQTFKVSLVKPNKARFESKTVLNIADGTTITKYDKVAKTYLKKPQTDANLREVFAGVDSPYWSAFFSADAVAGFNKTESAGVVKRGANSYNSVKVTVDPGAKITNLLYLDQATNMLKQAEFIDASGINPVSTLMNVSSLKVGGDVNASLFAFVAPSDAKEIKESDLVAGKWITDFDEALKLAKSMNKPVFVDCYEDWCHWCHVLADEVFPTELFQAATKGMVLAKINTGIQTHVKQTYKISAFPTNLMLDANGKELDRIVGYMPAPEYSAEVKKLRAKHGI